jgi:predicted ABC-type ATPase
MPNLYIISGCNGAGKTPASYYILPEILNCKKFVNADEIEHDENVKHSDDYRCEIPSRPTVRDKL